MAIVQQPKLSHRYHSTGLKSMCTAPDIGTTVYLAAAAVSHAALGKDPECFRAFPGREEELDVQAL